MDEDREHVGEGEIDCHCTDCGKDTVPGEDYVVVPPFDRRDKHDGREAYMLCVSCWDKMIGAAFMTIIR